MRRHPSPNGYRLSRVERQITPRQFFKPSNDITISAVYCAKCYIVTVKTNIAITMTAASDPRTEPKATSFVSVRFCRYTRSMFCSRSEMPRADTGRYGGDKQVLLSSLTCGSPQCWQVIVAPSQFSKHGPFDPSQVFSHQQPQPVEAEQVPLDVSEVPTRKPMVPF